MKHYPWIVRTGIGQDSHRFLSKSFSKPCTIGGVIFDDTPGLQANSDGDVIFHALCNAISSLTHEIILGKKADEILKNDGITDSRYYLLEALKTLEKKQITHVAIILEGLRPKFLTKYPEIRENIANILQIPINSIGITSTTGEGLTDFGCGDGVQCFCIVTTMEFSEAALK